MRGGGREWLAAVGSGGGEALTTNAGFSRDRSATTLFTQSASNEYTSFRSPAASRVRPVPSGTS